MGGREGLYLIKIDLKQVIFAVESASEAFQEYFDTQTGETVALADPFITGERDEALAELIENSPGRFLPFPSKYEIHEYRIMADFVDELRPSAAREELTGAIRGKGAFRRFKNGIRYHRLEQGWYDYLAQAQREIAIRWCEETAWNMWKTRQKCNLFANIYHRHLAVTLQFSPYYFAYWQAGVAISITTPAC